MEAGERAIDLTRAFNAREGLTRDEDTLPKRLMDPLPDGAFAGKPFGPDILNSMLDNYYELRGWDKKSGVPTRATLQRVGLDSVADELGKMKVLPN